MSIGGCDDNTDFAFRTVGPSRTKQSEAAACDINNIVSRWMKSGSACDLTARVGQFLDVSNVPDFHAACNFVAGAKSLFLELPAEVREEFNNDPGRFLKFASNPANFDKLVSMGLASKPVPPGPAPAAPAGSPDSPLAGEAGEAAQAAPASTTTP